LPILMLTADITNETKQKALSSGAKDFLTKPLDLSEVILRVRNLLETRLLHIRVREQNEELERKVQERTRQLAESRVEILDRLALAGEYRDQDTAEHTRRVGNLAAALAASNGSSSEFVELIRHAAALHDIGKIGVPDHILRKLGALDSHEFDIMKDHARIGARILSGSSDALLNMAQSIALTHHEWWDGSGYPSGLSGERAYKKAWPLDATIIQLKKQSGKQFDPDLTRAMVGLLEDSGLGALAEATVSGMASAEAPAAEALGVVGEESIS
jgi:putative two-component system response regulator